MRLRTLIVLLLQPLLAAAAMGSGLIRVAQPVVVVEESVLEEPKTTTSPEKIERVGLLEDLTKQEIQAICDADRIGLEPTALAGKGVPSLLPIVGPEEPPSTWSRSGRFLPRLLAYDRKEYGERSAYLKYRYQRQVPLEIPLDVVRAKVLDFVETSCK